MNDLQDFLRQYSGVILEQVQTLEYEHSRAESLELLKRKIDRKAYLIRLQDAEPTKERNTAINSLETEITTLISLIQSFDTMANQLRQEVVTSHLQADRANRLNENLKRLINAEVRAGAVWSDLAFRFYRHTINTPKTRS